MHLPLSGKNVLVTREASQAKYFSDKILEYGGHVYEVPLLKITCRNDTNNQAIFNNLIQFEWIFFTSVNGVQCFFSLLEQNHLDVPKIKFAAVGHKTEDALQQYGYTAELVPAIYDGENLVDEFLRKYNDIGQVLLVQGSRSRDVIERGLHERGISYQSIVVYETRYNDDIGAELKEVLSTTELDFITFTSPSTVEAFKRLYAEEVSQAITIVCIGNTTERRAIELGFKNTISPKVYTVESMVEIMCNQLKER
ncbi:uroporphyrinogen-III synthase [Ornithinibacillus scapharcae]|uniref:uroporphyrinogen-III synthase n=1 Tax=Ornithinibacillus scapharcae TaxID=1147159 RepID=UPI000225BF5D|nr:uroporphyrinogen-III synthase [Ornithinibacillus scapharcae]